MVYPDNSDELTDDLSPPASPVSEARGSDILNESTRQDIRPSSLASEDEEPKGPHSPSVIWPEDDPSDSDISIGNAGYKAQSDDYGDEKSPMEQTYDVLSPGDSLASGDTIPLEDTKGAEELAENGILSPKSLSKSATSSHREENDEEYQDTSYGTVKDEIEVPGSPSDELVVGAEELEEHDDISSKSGSSVDLRATEYCEDEMDIEEPTDNNAFPSIPSPHNDESSEGPVCEDDQPTENIAFPPATSPHSDEHSEDSASEDDHPIENNTYPSVSSPYSDEHSEDSASEDDQPRYGEDVLQEQAQQDEDAMQVDDIGQQGSPSSPLSTSSYVEEHNYDHEHDVSIPPVSLASSSADNSAVSQTFDNSRHFGTDNPGSVLLGSPDDSDTAKFAPVLSHLRKDQLPLLALEALGRISPEDPLADRLPTLQDPLYGSSHILFPLVFSEDFCWLVKIPVNGFEGRWDGMSTRALISEAKTMHFLREKSHLPIPEVYGYSPTTKNFINCPYILMEFIPGVPLYDVWFGHRLNNVDISIVRERRCRALKGVASAMIKLGKHTWDKIGIPLYDDRGDISGVGPYRILDVKATLERARNEGREDSVYIESEPSAICNGTFWLDRWDEERITESDAWDGLIKILRNFIEWVPEEEGSGPFCLSHPHFDIRNFLVSEDGELLSIINWNNATFSGGNEGYPSWLTRDWDNAMYAWDENMENGIRPEGKDWEDSPESLAEYRKIYNQLMEEERQAQAQSDLESRVSLNYFRRIYNSVLSNVDKKDYGTGLSRVSVGYYCDILYRMLARIRSGQTLKFNPTRISLITDNLSIAARTPESLIEIVERVVRESWIAFEDDHKASGQRKGVECPDGKPDASTMALMIINNEMSPELMNELKIGFKALLYKEGL